MKATQSRYPQSGPGGYLPKIFDRSRVDRVENVNQADAEAAERGASPSKRVSSPASPRGALAVALRLSLELENAVIVTIVCDRGDRYLS